MVAAASPVVDERQEIHLPPVVETPQPNPIAALARAMRGRWKAVVVSAALLGPAMSAAGYFAGVQLYESQAILRVYPQESNILYATGNDSVLKTFDSFVKAETTYVASEPVMARSVEALALSRPDLANEIKTSDLAGSVEIKRSDSLIVLKTRSKDRHFAREKLEAVIASYLALKSEAEEKRSAVRLSELHDREAEISQRLSALRTDQLEVGGEFGLNALAKAHIEKIAQIDGLTARKSEVAATIAALEAESSAPSADTSDQEIMRATLLDRAMADLSFERAKLMSELAALRAGFLHPTNVQFRQQEQAKLDQIAVIEQAAADRREQIRVLGQTGALTDVAATDSQTTVVELRSLFEKVSSQLATARQEARDLNRRRIELDGVENEIEEAERLLEETRHALEVIRLESGRALPGYTVVMSPPSQSVDPAEDSKKMFMAAGMVGGFGFAGTLILALALFERRVRFAEALAPFENRIPVHQVSDADEADPHAADLLRNELQLQSFRKPRLVGKAPVIAVTRACNGETTDLARSLAESFARARMKTLFVDADLGNLDEEVSATGWQDVLLGQATEPRANAQTAGLWELAEGIPGTLEDRMVSAPMVRAAIEQASDSFDVVVVSAGSLKDRLSAQLILSNSDVGVLAMAPSDVRADVFAQIDRLDELPRNGSVAVMRNALRGDPWVAIRT
ncbi:hypothetical protein [Ruegeria conchae]|uniref:hypothetical protein n=1 Tax=Ruegeria conchae TaxID=981384 RepID=UPI0029C65B5A|nr:hypothetical protein [Ruegeria conchae]